VARQGRPRRLLTYGLHTVETVDRPADDAALRRRTASLGEDGALLAGGTWLFSVPQPHLRGLVDLTAPSWPALTVTGSGLTVAATATFAEVVGAGSLPEWTAVPLIRGCAEALVGSHKIWNVATVGGNIALALPAAPMITLAATLDGVAVVWPAMGGEIRMPVVDLVVGAHRTTLRRGDVLRALELPARALRSRTALRTVSLSPLGRSAVLLGGRVDADGAVAIAVTAARERPVVLRFPTSPTVRELDDAVCGLDVGGPWYDDPHGSPQWRRAMTRRLAQEIRDELR